jgi:hypothetical protein
MLLGIHTSTETSHRFGCGSYNLTDALLGGGVHADSPTDEEVYTKRLGFEFYPPAQPGAAWGTLNPISSSGQSAT